MASSHWLFATMRVLTRRLSMLEKKGSFSLEGPRRPPGLLSLKDYGAASYDVAKHMTRAPPAALALEDYTQQLNYADTCDIFTEGGSGTNGQLSSFPLSFNFQLWILYFQLSIHLHGLIEGKATLVNFYIICFCLGLPLHFRLPFSIVNHSVRLGFLLVAGRCLFQAACLPFFYSTMAVELKWASPMSQRSGITVMSTVCTLRPTLLC